ncbi:transposase [Streptomyces caeruleatus]|uniref:transposase n=1 Tax=Streptomyces caeruleatus TaxID=661399 RepID=UPI00099E627C|nr:transposase [Streptomyces caeruleatus]
MGTIHLITDGHGTPLAVLLTGGNRNDVTQLMALLDAIPPVRGRVGRPRRKRDSLFADCGYDHDIYRDQVRKRGIVPAIARVLRGCTAFDACGSDRNGGRTRSVPQARLPPDPSPATRLIVLAAVRARKGHGAPQNGLDNK